jgi:hypothetical protein
MDRQMGKEALLPHKVFSVYCAKSKKKSKAIPVTGREGP